MYINLNDEEVKELTDYTLKARREGFKELLKRLSEGYGSFYINQAKQKLLITTILLLKLGYTDNRLGIWEVGLFNTGMFGLKDSKVKDEFYRHLEEL